MYRVIFSVLLAAFCSVLPQKCGAANEHLSFGQSASGEAIATILGDVLYCDGMLGGFRGSPAVNFLPEGIEISSITTWGECSPSPPPYPPPTPYQLTANMGTLVDGQYSVTWIYMLPPVANPVMTAQAVFWVESGEVAIFRGSFE
jgi:hypothetical protein